MRKPAFAYAKTKTQISFAVTAKLISAFVFATRIVQSLYFLNPKFQARFVSDLVGNPEDRFSHNEAQMDNIHYDKTPMQYSVILTGINIIIFRIFR